MRRRALRAFRRNVLAPVSALVSVACASCAVPSPRAAPDRASAVDPAKPAARCHPGESCWPTAAEWQELRARVHGHLEESPTPLRPCQVNASSAACAAVIGHLNNPFALEDQPGATQSVGWLGAWTASPSAYAVVAESAADIVAAVDFAREHGLRLVIKGTGHDYLGRSNAPDSLLVWTHRMRKVTVDDAFVVRGCAPGSPDAVPVPAVTLEAGARWMDAYDEVTVKHHRYVQGGGCTSVGAVGGFLQGGGFGSWSKKYGIAAASMLEAEVVTASGDVVIANACHNEDLFWALRGGGGGTFGVVTKATLRTHPLATFYGTVHGEIKAKSDGAFAELLERFLVFYGERLNNESWGEQVEAQGDNALRVSMNFQGMSGDEAKAVWAPFVHWVEEDPGKLTAKLEYGAMPGDRMWDHSFFETYVPDAIRKDARPDAPPNQFWWSGDGEQVATYWYSYQSRWIPFERMSGAATASFAHALFAASREQSVALHFNKGQSGASPEALARDRQTSMNPAVLGAAALAIVATGDTAYPGVRGHEPDKAAGEKAHARVSAAMKILRDATPGSGSYVNETDYFEPGWQEAFWGTNYPRLLAIKHRYDPSGFFTCHHCVGSEE